MLSPDDRVREFYPSLYLNMGKAHEDIGNREAAKRFYAVDKCGSDVPSEKPNQFTSQSKMHTHPHRTMTITWFLYRTKDGALGLSTLMAH